MTDENAAASYILAQPDPAQFLADLVGKIQEAKKQADLGYEFSPSSYTYRAMVACGHAERAVAGIHMLLPQKEARLKPSIASEGSQLSLGEKLEADQCPRHQPISTGRDSGDALRRVRWAVKGTVQGTCTPA